MEEMALVSACILICCEPGKHSEVAKRVGNVKGVVRAFSVSGRWDVIADVEAADVKSIGEIALMINGLAGIRVTETLLEALL
jgi:DNA-binding Lrp family transcriptional regulator